MYELAVSEGRSSKMDQFEQTRMICVADKNGWDPTFYSAYSSLENCTG